MVFTVEFLKLVLFVCKSIGFNHIWNLLVAYVPFQYFCSSMRGCDFVEYYSDHYEMLHISDPVYVFPFKNPSSSEFCNISACDIVFCSKNLKITMYSPNGPYFFLYQHGCLLPQWSPDTWALHTAFQEGGLAEEATWQAVVLVPKGKQDYRGIGLVEVIWKVVAAILNRRLTASIA